MHARSIVPQSRRLTPSGFYGSALHRYHEQVHPEPPHFDSALFAPGLFTPGQRVAVAVSGGADSVCLLRLLLAQREALGLVLSVAHVHHGLRGAETDADADFVAALAGGYDLPFHLHRVDTHAAAAANREGLEEAARTLRYAFFSDLLTRNAADVVATAHTLDDQAETVLHKLLRGAWTEGLSGIHPTLKLAGGPIVRPLLSVSRAEVEASLAALGQPWREDSTNREFAFTRNRIRHQLLPQLATFNPQIAGQLARLAAIAAGEEAWWQAELDRLLPTLLLPGRPARGGGRSTSTLPGAAGLAMELERLRTLHPAVVRRVLRAAARRLGCSLSFEHTERLLALCVPLPSPGSDRQPASSRARLELPGGLLAERSLRELRLTRSPASTATLPEYSLAVPGAIDAPEYGLRLSVDMEPNMLSGSPPPETPLILRTGRPGDRVTLRHSRGPKHLKEVFERLHIPSEDRPTWPLVAAGQRVVWMRGAEVDAPEFLFRAEAIPSETGSERARG